MIKAPQAVQRRRAERPARVDDAPDRERTLPADDLPTLPPVIMKDAITNVYSVIASWIPVTSVPTSLATVAIAVFITVMSRAITNCADADSARPEALAATEDAVAEQSSQQKPYRRHRLDCAARDPASSCLPGTAHVAAATGLHLA